MFKNNDILEKIKKIKNSAKFNDKEIDKAEKFAKNKSDCNCSHCK